jgi:hypothetical protein
MTRSKWLIYTVLLSLMPVIVRLVVGVIQEPMPNIMIDPGDLVAFVLALAVTNVNLLEHESRIDPTFKTTVIGLSLTHFAVAAALFAMISLGSSKISLNGWKLLVVAIAISMSSLVLSFVSANRLSTLKATDGAVS